MDSSQQAIDERLNTLVAHVAQNVRAAAAAEQRLDAVLVTPLVDIKSRRKYHEGTTTARPFITSYGYYGQPYYAPSFGPGFGTYYTVVYQYTHTAGYYETSKTYYLEATLHAANDGKLVWALMSETVNPDSVTKVIHGPRRAIERSA